MDNTTIEQYNRLAANYDNSFKTEQAETEDALVSKAVAYFGNSQKNILDIGSGTGHLLTLCPTIERMRYVGVEPADAMNKIARAKFPNFLFQPKSAEEISIPTYQWANIVYYGYGSACYSNLATLIENYFLHCKVGTELVMMLYAKDCGRRTVLEGEKVEEYTDSILERILRRYKGFLDFSIKPFLSRKYVQCANSSPICADFNDAYWLVLRCSIKNGISEAEKAARLIHSPFIDSVEWTYAKTYEWCPHEYLVKNETNKKEFESLVMFIRQFGYRERFKRGAFTRYNFGAYKYWTMGNPLEETTVINRAIIHTDEISSKI